MAPRKRLTANTLAEAGATQHKCGGKLLSRRGHFAIKEFRSMALIRTAESVRACCAIKACLSAS